MGGVMRRLIVVILLIIGMAIPMNLAAYEELDLPYESVQSEGNNRVRDAIVFNGYVNSKEVTVVANVLGCVYNLCSERVDDFCSDEQGVLVISAADTGPIVDLVKKMDDAVDSQAMVQVYLTKRPYLSGVRRIVDVKLDY